MVKIAMLDKICCFQLHSFALIWGWIGAVCSALLALVGLISLANVGNLAGGDVKLQYGESVKYFGAVELIFTS